MTPEAEYLGVSRRGDIDSRNRLCRSILVLDHSVIFPIVLAGPRLVYSLE